LSYSLIASGNCESMFYMFTKLQSVDFKNFNSVQSTSMANMFYGDTSLTTLLHETNLATNLATSTASMFYNCSALTDFDTSGFRTPLVTTMSNMFYNCASLTSLDISHFEVDRVTTFSQMFYGCTNLETIEFDTFNAQAATTMNKMFYGCSSLVNPDFSKFTTTIVTNFEGMFSGCSSLTNIDLSSFRTANATTFKDMFYNCTSLATLDISNMTSDHVTDTSQMFAGTLLTTLDLSKFDTSNVTTMTRMFYQMPNITTIYVSNLWTTLNVTAGTNMFTDDTNIVGGFGTTYSSSNVGVSYAHVDVPDGAGYLTACDVQYKGVFIYDEYNTLLSVSYVGTESPYTLPVDSEYDYFKCNSTNYQPGATVDYSIFDGVDEVQFTMYYVKYTLTFSNGTNGSNVTRSATYTHKGQSAKSVSSGGKVPIGATVTVNVSCSSSYRNPTFTAQTSSGTTVNVTQVTEYSKYTFVMPAANVTCTFTCSSNGFCVASGTLVTLADGTQKPVENITLADELLIMNHETGMLDVAEINFIEYDGEAQYDVISLEFANGTISRMIYEHGYFDLDLNQYVYIHADDYMNYIGHRFYCIIQDGDQFIPQETTLVAGSVESVCTGCYSLTTKYHLNYFIDGLLSMPGGISGLFNIFEYGENLKYDQADKDNAISTFGLLSYDFFEDYITYEQYLLYPAQYLGVSLGRGYLTWEGLQYLIDRYC
ncbi:MAG: BspA family leucine-rich repeat surface protein, partial [Clostridia bacterium]|nr:BspA family leucine-rich repeat surface protein [Clostridia bacterium]